MLKVDEEFYLYCTVIMYIMGLQMSSSQKLQKRCDLKQMFHKHDNLHFPSNQFWHRHGLAINYIRVLVLKVVLYSLGKVEEIFVSYAFFVSIHIEISYNNFNCNAC